MVAHNIRNLSGVKHNVKQAKTEQLKLFSKLE